MNYLRKKLIALLLVAAMALTLTPSLGLAYAEDAPDAPAAAVVEDTAAEYGETAAEYEDPVQQVDPVPEEADIQQDTDADQPEEAAQITEEPEDEGAVIIDVIESKTEKLTPEEDIPEPEELYDEYLRMKASGSRVKKTAGGRLKGANAGIYSYINSEIAKVASGNRESTIIRYSADDLFGEKNYWTAADLGLARLSDANGEITVTARKKCQDLRTVLDALLADNPYGLYWYDKTQPAYGVSFSCYLEKRNGEERLVVTGKGYIKLPVAEAYSREKKLGTYYIDTGIGKASSAVVSKAQAIVDSYEGFADRDRLTKYGEEICRLVEYNDEAAEKYSDETDREPYGDPWQLIWVFDGDTSTNVVCEGYAKAFKFLCDLTEFSSPVDCLVATGKMDGAGHMWNVVTPDDGYNYLVDVTNSDVGTMLVNSGVFMNKSPVSGTYPAYCFRRFGLPVRYTYDKDCMNAFCSNELMIPGDGNGHEQLEDHDLVKVNAVPATCTRAGNIEYYVCRTCEFLFADRYGRTKISEKETIIKAPGHTAPVYIGKKNATCQAVGIKGHYECARCGAYMDKNKKLLSTAAKKKLVISKKAHSYKQKNTGSRYLRSAATCTKKAKYYYSCKCGRKSKKTFTYGRALGHRYVTTLKPATTGSDGSIINKCSRCGKKKKKTVIYKASKVSIPKKYQSVAYKGNNAEKTTVSVKNRKNKTISKAYYDISFDNDYVHRTGTVTIRFKGNYSGVRTLHYKITGVPEQ